MTSMPASRSARAITLAPRSCPSSPGLAMTTLIFWLMFLRHFACILFKSSFTDTFGTYVTSLNTGTSSYSPHTSRSASHISPTVA